MEYYEIVGDKILRLCRKYDLSIGQLAAKCHMNKATIDNILEGKCRKPRIQTLYKIADAFHMSVRELLDERVEMDCPAGAPETAEKR